MLCEGFRGATGTEPSPLAQRVSNGQRLMSPDEGRLRGHRYAIELDCVEAWQEMREEGAQLVAGEGGAQAEIYAHPECNLVWTPDDFHRARHRKGTGEGKTSQG